MKNRDKIIFAVSVFIFGTVGVIRRFIPLPSGFVAMSRGFIGAASLCLIMLIMRKKPDTAAIKKNFLKLVLSGICIALNWVLLFEGLNHTTVAAATLCYYMEPIFFVIGAAAVFKEKFTRKNLICTLAAIAGMVLVSGVLGASANKEGNLLGIALSLGAAIAYAAVTLINKGIKDISPYDKTVVQLVIAATVIIPYIMLAETVTADMFSVRAVVLLVTLGVLNTSLAYAGYFGTVERLPGHTVAVLSYIDPVVAVILSAVLLGEGLDAAGVIGAVMIIGAAMANEL